MLKKLLKIHNLTHFSHNPLQKPPPEESSLPLRIVHAGGAVECYFMAMPAVRIMDKYPSFLLTRPEFFRRPWDSIVNPDQILSPGEKYFIVSDRTVRKLQRRIRKPNAGISSLNLGESSEEVVRVSDGSGRTGRRKKRESKKEESLSVQDSGKNSSLESRVGRSRQRFTPSASWQPSLETVAETHGFNE